jgi:RimJ/RimL family protein N-acetyltransferase
VPADPCPPAPELETSRFAPRPFSEPGLEELHALFTDADVRRYLLDDEIV